MQNICKFIPPNRTADHIQPINFVYETKTDPPLVFSPCTVYRVHLVTQGCGEIQCGDQVRTVKSGDVFFAFPAVYQRITSTQGLKYLYISYVGIRAGAEMERLGIHYKNFVFEDLEGLQGLWEDAIKASPEVIDLISEGLLLYTLSRIGNRTLGKERSTEPSQSAKNALLIKKHIDDSVAYPALCTGSIAEHFCYNKKYISTLFKKHFQMGLSEYINTLRINKACSRVEEGQRSVGELAAEVGFHDALYFSKVFKKKTGLSPKEYMLALDREKEQETIC